MAPGHHRCWHRCPSSRQAALHFFSIADRNLENRLALLLAGELFASRIGFDMYLHVCAGCMAALQAEHFLQVHGAAEEEAARKREADAMDRPSSKRARTASEPEAAADALLMEMAAEQAPEQAPTDDEALQGVLDSSCQLI